MCPVADTAPVFTPALRSARTEVAAEDAARCATAGGHRHCSLACAAEGTGGQEERVVQSYSSKAEVERLTSSTWAWKF